MIPRTGRAVHLPQDAAKRDANRRFYRIELTAAAADNARDNGYDGIANLLDARYAALLPVPIRVGQEQRDV